MIDDRIGDQKFNAANFLQVFEQIILETFIKEAKSWFQTLQVRRLLTD